MVAGIPVIDAVTHGYNWGRGNWSRPDTGRYADAQTTPTDTPASAT
jgi:hypothetical protein